jgi:hypothetical protein
MHRQIERWVGRMDGWMDVHTGTRFVCGRNCYGNGLLHVVYFMMVCLLKPDGRVQLYAAVSISGRMEDKQTVGDCRYYRGHRSRLCSQGCETLYHLRVTDSLAPQSLANQ